MVKKEHTGMAGAPNQQTDQKTCNAHTLDSTSTRFIPHLQIDCIKSVLTVHDFLPHKSIHTGIDTSKYMVRHDKKEEINQKILTRTVLITNAQP